MKCQFLKKLLAQAFSPVLFYIAIFPQPSMAEVPLLWDNLTVSHPENSDKIEPKILTRSQRRVGSFTSVVSPREKYTVILGDTIYIPVWNETAEGAGVSIVWSVDNRTPSLFSSVVAHNIQPTHRSHTLGTNHVRRGALDPLPYRSDPLTNIGCEARHNGGIEITDNSRGTKGISGVSAFVCVQARSVGTGTLLIGERVFNQESADFTFGTSNTGSSPSQYSVSGNLNREVSISVVDPVEDVVEKNILEYATLSISNGIMRVHPMNRSLNEISCDENISVEVLAGIDSVLTPISKCAFDIKYKSGPDHQNPPFFGGSNISANVAQERELQVGSASVIKRYTARSVHRTLPFFPSPTGDAAWAIAVCPTLIFPGSVFGCKIEIRNSEGTPAVTDARVDPQSIGSGSKVTYLGQSSKDGVYIACFKLKDSVANLSRVDLRGTTRDEIHFRSMPIWVDEKARARVAIFHEQECQNPTLP